MSEKWNKLKAMFGNASNNVQIKENIDLNAKILDSVNIDVNSFMGQVMMNISNMCINGYFRMLTGDEKDALNISEFNKQLNEECTEGKLVIAYDIWGGLFAVDKRNINDKSNLWYFAPDQLEWEDMEVTYLDFLVWVCDEDFNMFHSSFTWAGMELEIRDIKDQQGVLVYPYLWSQECDIETASKKFVSILEIIRLNADMYKKIK